jgi:hypothetical protein
MDAPKIREKLRRLHATSRLQRSARCTRCSIAMAWSTTAANAGTRRRAQRFPTPADQMICGAPITTASSCVLIRIRPDGQCPIKLMRLRCKDRDRHSAVIGCSAVNGCKLETGRQSGLVNWRYRPRADSRDLPFQIVEQGLCRILLCAAPYFE